jgi:predicted transcriptional regulator
MAELPFHLKALPPEALDVLRYYAKTSEQVAHALAISDGAGLSERTFGKAIRRLVTKGYVRMDGDQAYRLTDDGQEAVEELMVFDSQESDTDFDGQFSARRKVSRHMMLITPRQLKAGISAELYLAFNPAADEQQLDVPAEVVIRLSLLNAQPSRPQEVSFQLDNDLAYNTFRLTPGNYQQIRIRAQAYQLGPNPDDIEVVGGMYVDVDVTASPAQNGLVAYGADLNLSEPN